MPPSRSASGRNGRIVSFASAALTLTANGTKSPARASSTIEAIVSPALSCASRVQAPRCGVTITESSSNSGDSVIGSVENTSSAAPAMTPSRRHSARSPSCTMPPRATLMTRSDGFALSSRSRLMSPIVSGVFGRWMVRKSDSVIDLVEAEQLDAHLLGAVLGHERVVRHEAHAEALGPVGDQLADAAEADDAERLVGEFDALPAAALPATVDERGVGLRHVAGRRQQQRHRVLGGRDDVALRGVDHHHAAAGGRRRRRRCRGRCRHDRRPSGRNRRRARRRSRRWPSG